MYHSLLNSIILIGRLVRDPELRFTSNGKPYCTFTIAVDRNFKNSQGEVDTDFIDTITWGKSAESCAQYLAKGKLAAVSGRLQIRKNKQNDRTYINPEVVTREVQFLEWKDTNKSTDYDEQDLSNSKTDLF